MTELTTTKPAQLPPKEKSSSRRRKKKTRKEKKTAEEARANRLSAFYEEHDKGADQKVPDKTKIEYVEASEPKVEGTQFEEFTRVFAQFSANAARASEANDDELEADSGMAVNVNSDGGLQGGNEGIDRQQQQLMGSDEDDSDAEDDQEADSDNEEGSGKLSRKQRKRNRMSVAELKQKASRPEVVEWTDVNARDPMLLIAIKATRNIVPIPVHWSQKKKYLQYKRGMVKPPFELPDFIKATGITEMREAIKEKEESQKVKTRARDRVQPKMNKLTLDYQRLHDAFFRFQTPPPNLSSHGDLFYEGKESDVVYSFTPGTVSEELRSALSMPPLAPPPWLINMQRYGPPPSYPNLVIPGLNAPIPQGAQWGYHPGGWGRPPVDEFGRPLYGDVFAAAPSVATLAPAAVSADAKEDEAAIEDVPVRKYWGDLESGESSSEEESDDEVDDSGDEEEDETEGTATQQETPADLTSGVQTEAHIRSGLASIPSGLETPGAIQLRKNIAPENTSLYTILPEKASEKIEGIMGSQYTYDVGKAFDPSKKSVQKNDGGSRGTKLMGRAVEVALDSSELDNLDQRALEEKYQEATEAAQSGATGTGLPQEDLSDMVAEHAAIQARKRKVTDTASTRAKRSKDYKS